MLVAQLCPTIYNPRDCQASLSMEEYWSEFPLPSPGYLPYPGMEPRSSTLQTDALTSEPPGKPHFPEGMPFKTFTI